jgi:pimeloyl-ACP methyl ester carboxylesterase
MNHNTRLLKVNGQTIFFRELGTATQFPLLMIHGGPDWDHTYLLPAARVLSKKRRVILIDLRGCGSSSVCSDISGYSRNMAAQDIVHVIPMITTSKVHLLGFSFGGRLALSAVQQEPEHVASLILASTSLRGVVKWNQQHSERLVRQNMIPTMSDVYSTPGLSPAEKTRKLAIDSLPLDVWDLSTLPRVRHVVEGVSFGGEWGRAWSSGMLVPEQRDDAEWLETSKIPTLVVHGRHDFRFPVEDFDRIRNIRPDLYVKVLENAGHLAHLECTDEWCGVIEDFLLSVETQLSR